MDLQKEIDRLQKELDIVKAKYASSKEQNSHEEKFWIPKKDQEFYSLDLWDGFGESGIHCTKIEFDDPETDKGLLHSGFIYRIEELELIEKDLEIIQARQRIQRCADMLHGGSRYRFSFGEKNYRVTYDRDPENFDVDWDMESAYDAIYFNNQLLAEKCLELCRKDFEILRKGLSA